MKGKIVVNENAKQFDLLDWTRWEGVKALRAAGPLLGIYALTEDGRLHLCLENVNKPRPAAFKGATGNDYYPVYLKLMKGKGLGKTVKP